MKVYLSGGMHSKWRDQVKASVQGGISWLDPCLHGLGNPAEYTAWDLAAVRKCDVVFAYMETSNPSGVGLALEVGFGLALGKTVVLVDEKDDSGFAIVREAATLCYARLIDGIGILVSLEKMQ